MYTRTPEKNKQETIFGRGPYLHCCKEGGSSSCNSDFYTTVMAVSWKSRATTRAVSWRQLCRSLQLEGWVRMLWMMVEEERPTKEQNKRMGLLYL
jgi:hypothetical protein